MLRHFFALIIVVFGFSINCLADDKMLLTGTDSLATVGEFVYKATPVDYEPHDSQIVVYDHFSEKGKSGILWGYVTDETQIAIKNADLDPKNLRFLNGEWACVYAERKLFGSGEGSYAVITKLDVYLVTQR